MPQLDISTFPSQIFWLVVCFGILCFAMVAILIPRMSKIMETRTQELETLKAKAEKLMAEADALSAKNTKNFDEAKHQVHSQVAQMMSDLNKMRDDKIHAFEEQVRQQTHALSERLESDRHEIESKAKDVLEHLVQDMMSKLTNQTSASISTKG